MVGGGSFVYVGIDIRRSKVIRRSLEINDLIYWYWWLSQFLGTYIHWLSYGFGHSEATPHPPEGGGGGGREKVELGKGHHHIIGFPFLPPLSC